MVELVEMVLGPGATHVKVIGGDGPEALTVPEPLQNVLQVMAVMVGLIVMEAGWVMLKVWLRTQVRLSVIVTVCVPAQRPVMPAELPGPGFQV